MVPASLYCIYDNLTFVVLGTVNPSTYTILQQFRIVVTALMHQRMFKKPISNMQWVSLVLITVRVCGGMDSRSLSESFRSGWLYYKGARQA